MLMLPETSTLLLRLERGVLHVTFNRPERKNALSPQMIDELISTIAAASTAPELRAIVLRGAGGSFCAGADVKEMGKASLPRRASMPPDDSPRAVTARNNRLFGELVTAVRGAVQPVIAVVEGAVMGGGFGVVCASDIALALHDARFGMPETSLGLVPAQIAPFVVERIGLTQARRLMLTGARIDGREAARLGIVHEVFDDVTALEAGLDAVIALFRRCAPRANAATKSLVLATPGRELRSLLNDAAEVFADAATGDEAREGMAAFAEKRPPSWAKASEA
jgi:isohexenylglutaconyl-CoA hydratase